MPVVDSPPSAGTHVLTVGVGKTYATLSAAIGASADGDLIRVDAGTYTNDFATIHHKITIEGVGGMVNLVATIPPPTLKGILLVDNDVTIENVAFSGSAVPTVSGGNGAGIRYEGGKMVLINDSFVGNQDGLLATPVLGLAVNTISIDHCLFSGNGSGTGQTHNLYVNQVDSLTVTNSIFEKAVVGHEFKSRALINDIENNIFRDTPTGTASYDIDLPNGGKDLIKNNLIEKGPLAQNKFAIHYGGEAIPYVGSYLTLQNNIIVNDHGSSGVAVLNQTSVSVAITGNTLSNFAPGNILAGPGAITGNVDGTGAAIPDSTLTGVLPGATTVYTDDLPHSITLSVSNTAVEGGGGRLTVDAIAGHIVAIGGSGGMDFIEGPTSGGNLISTVANSVNSITVVGQDLIDSHGTDRIVVGMGNVTATVAGNATIDDGFNDDDKWSVTGTATMTGHGGRPVVSVGSAGNLSINGQLGYLEIIGNGGNEQYDVMEEGAHQSASIVGGAVDAKLYSGFFTIRTASGPQGALIRMGAGDGTITSVGNDIIYAGSGSETIILSGSATVYAGTGNLSVFGRGISTGATVYGNGGTCTIDGDTGNITYFGGAQNSTVQVRLSNIQLVGGNGLLTINGGSRETVIGGAGGINFNAPSGGANSITTAVGSKNILVLGQVNNVDSWGQDTIYGGMGNQVRIHGNSIFNGSAGGDNLTFSGNDTFIGVGQDIVTVKAGATLTVSAGIATNLHESNATVAYSVFNGSSTATATVTGGGASLSVGANRSIAIATDAGNATNVVLGNGTIAVDSAGADTIQAGSGADTIVLHQANTVISGGAGSLSITNNDWTGGDDQTVHGGSGAINYSQSTGDLTFIGGSGDTVISGGAGTLHITAGSGNTTVSGGWGGGFKFIAGSGTDNVALTSNGGEIVFGAGNVTAQIADWGAAAVFDFIAGSGGGTDVIQHFRVGIDKLNLMGVSVQTQQTVGGSTNLLLSDNTHLQLIGVANAAHLFG